MNLDFETKSGFMAQDRRRRNDEVARKARKAGKKDRIAAVNAACRAANANPEAARPYLERAVASLPKSHRIVVQAGPGGVQRFGAVHKSDAMAQAVMGRLPARKTRLKEQTL